MCDTAAASCTGVQAPPPGNTNETSSLRKWRQSTMEQDVVAQASDFLAGHFRDQLTEADRLTLEQWLTSRIEVERKGWKSMLQRCLQEVERERKVALEVRGVTQGVNACLEEWLGGLELPTEAMDYEGADARTHSMRLLETNVDTLLRYVAVLLEEREKCFACLPGGDRDKGLHVALSDRLIEMHTESQATARKHTGEMVELNQAVSALQARLLEVEGIQNSRDELHSKEIEVLEGIIAHEREQINAINHWNKAEVATQAGSGLCCIEVATQVAVEGEDSEDSNSMLDGKFCMPTPIRSVTISQSVSSMNGKAQWKTHMQDFEHDTHLSLPLKHSDDYEEMKSTSYKERSSARSLDAPDSNRRQTINMLQGQVVEFGERLEQAKDEVERYQRQLVWMKTTPHNTLINNELNSMRSAKEHCNKYSDSSLSGTPKELIPVTSANKDVIILRSHMRKRQIAPARTANGTSHCLRCHKLYKVRDNHRKACKYHPRSKKKIEKYNGSGKLVTVTFLWECCLQATEATGCACGEHV